jgi:MFS family permease
VNQQHIKQTSLTASLALTGLASSGTSVIWNGLPFIAKRDYGFGETENLALYVLIGIVYVTGALTSGVCTRLLRPYISMRTIIAMLLCTIALVCSLPLMFTGSFVIWTSGAVAGFCSAWLWPIIESYLVAGRHGPEMRRAIGWWNIVWMVAVASSMIAMAPLMDKHASMVIVGIGFLNLIAIGILPWYSKNPPAHDIASSSEHVPESYRDLLRGARVLLPVSYAINGVLAPLLPFVLAGIAIDIFWQTPVVSIWMVARVIVTAIMWKSGRWHGKWSVLWVAMFAMATGFLFILSAFSLPLLITGLALFGAGMGATYYVALYYAMSVGRAEIDAGGKHEALIGMGYMAGPLVGLSSLQIAGSGTDVAVASGFGPIIYVVLAFLALGIVALAVFCIKAR